MNKNRNLFEVRLKTLFTDMSYCALNIMTISVEFKNKEYI